MDVKDALVQLQEPRRLTILHISEPILNAVAQSQTTDSQISRSSTSFSDPRIASTPSTLAADLTHYRDLFSKLRFSYVEQETKERFLRAVVAEQPDFVAASDNVELEEKLRVDKESLKGKKQEVREIIGELEEQGRHLARRKSIMLQRQIEASGTADENRAQDTNKFNSRLPSSNLSPSKSTISRKRSSRCNKSKSPKPRIQTCPSLFGLRWIFSASANKSS